MKYDIETLKRKMLVKYPFFGSVVTNVNYKEDKIIETAGTNGKTIYYNPQYLEKLSIEKQLFVFSHEVCHIAFQHILRSEGKDPYIWNIATDAVINAFLKRDGLIMADCGVNIPEAINYDAEQMYNRLLKDKERQDEKEKNKEHSKNNLNDNQSQQSKNSFNNNDNQNQNNSLNSGDDIDEDKQNKDVGHDTHSMWKDAVKKYKEEQENKGNCDDKKDSENELKKKQEELNKMGEKDAFYKNSEEKNRRLRKLKESIATEASMAGTTTNGDIRNVSDIGIAKPLIDWRYLLKEAITYDIDWSYANAYLENGVLIPNLEEKPFPETEIILDTSGSINEILLKNFLRECKNIFQSSKVKVGCFDTKFYGFTELTDIECIEKMIFLGGGGTDFNVAVQSFSQRVDNKIIFTDGQSSMPNMSLDVIWIVFGGKEINPPGGKVINITREQLNRLCYYQDDYRKNSRKH